MKYRITLKSPEILHTWSDVRDVEEISQHGEFRFSTLDIDHRQSATYANAEVQVVLDIPSPKRWLTALELIAKNRLIRHGWIVSTGAPTRYKANRAASDKQYSHEFHDADIQIFTKIAVELHERSSGFIDSLFWRYGRVYSQPTVYMDTIEFLQDNGQWHIVPIHVYDAYIASGSCHLTIEKPLDDIQNIISGTEGVPIYQNMLREAFLQPHTDSSFVMAVAALEIAVKRTIVILRPDTEYLIENMASPPIEKLITEYLQEFSEVKMKVPATLPIDLIKEIRKIVSLRNKIVHIGSVRIHNERRHRFFKSICDAIYYLEWFQGTEWSLQRLHTRPHL